MICNSTSGYIPKILIQKDICTPMFMAALFMILKHENNLGVHQQMSGLARCDIYE